MKEKRKRKKNIERKGEKGKERKGKERKEERAEKCSSVAEWKVKRKGKKR